MTAEGTMGTVAFETNGQDRLTVVDPIERRRYQLRTSGPASVDSTPTDVFQFPVDATTSVRTSSIELPTIVSVYVRDEDGRVLGEIQQNARSDLPEDAYCLECCSPIKLYLRVNSALQISTGDDSVTVQFPDERVVHVGARSRHERPAATVTTTDDPADVLHAISTFGSALKTTSPERSFPTLRGHPPEIELGQELSIPDGLEAPADDVHIEVPPQFDALYPVAPLAYYLGAPVRAGDVPRLVGDGFSHEFGADVSGAVQQVLEQVFLLECVTRTEGLYPIELHERVELEKALDAEVDFESLYDAAQSDRLESFLEIPHEVVEPYVPDWPIAGRIAPNARGIEALPHLVDDLAIVHTASPTRVDPEQVEYGNLHGLVRGTSSPVNSTFVQSGSEATALEVAWIGDGMPVDASKAVPEAYRNRIGRSPHDGDIEIVVVCNDAEMDSERDAADEVYGSRDDLRFDVTVHRDCTRSELEAVLSREYDLFHYIGHIEEGGFSCADGLLDASSIDAVGVDAFVLNACQSYEQGIQLAERGAIGGIVTLRDVVNVGAVRIGKSVAQLLNCGFPLHAALDVARTESVVGPEYTVVGDGGLNVVQSRYGIPTLYDVESRRNHYEVTFTTFAPGGVGAVTLPLVAANDLHYLASGSGGTFELTHQELLELLTNERAPVRMNDAVYMSTDLVDLL